ncbi:PAS/PAC sensor signal transduction histidine kinase [Rhodoplanes sp. Z2-YC6860]|nr:PAS/PAC sensor signal transduction histidine kinase [Rhodoplanes sp. Z2-YC6860]
MVSETKSPLEYLSDPRLAPYATGSVPVWLWSADATHILWGNPTAAAIFNAASPAALQGHTIDPKGSAALQIARLAGTLPHGSTPRLERLRGFGGRFGGALLCNCARITMTDRVPAILVVSTEAAGPKLSLGEQAKRLLAGTDAAAALFAADGALLSATAAAGALLGNNTSLAALNATPLAEKAFASGRAEGAINEADMTLQRVGADASTLLLAMLTPRETVAAPAPVRVETEVEPPNGEAPAAPALDTMAPMPATDTPQAPPLQPETAQTTPAAPAEPGPAEPASAEPAAAPPSPAAIASERRAPLRFVWQMDSGQGFSIASDEFLALIGKGPASTLGRPWTEIATALSLDPEGQVERALASRDTWSGIIVSFPVEGSNARVDAELSGLPVFDRDRNLRGYRGFGICRNVAQLNQLIQARAAETPGAPASRVEPSLFRDEPPPASTSAENVVPFPSAPTDGPPALSPIERKAFSELASRLTAQLRGRELPQNRETPSPTSIAPEAVAASPQSPAEEPAAELPSPPPAVERAPEHPALPAAADSASDARPILDRLPVGVLVYRLDKLIYANRAFLEWTGYGELSALEEAGGLDALFVGPSRDEPTPNNGSKALTIATNKGSQVPVKARLFTSPWNGESALVLMLTSVGTDDNKKNFEQALREAKSEAGELRAILDTTADGVVLLDANGQITSINTSAEVMFGYQSRELAGRPFASLLAQDNQHIAEQMLDSVNRQPSAEPNGRDVIGRRSSGTEFPLFITFGALPAENKRCAIARDLTLWKRAEQELIAAKREAERVSATKSDFLAKISHEIRTPLNAMIGFSEIMMQERFGSIGNERYQQYLADIHASGGHVISLLNDLLDLSKIEAGKLELNFADVNLNDLTQQCVAMMQPQANRERIIIRTSLPQDLPQVTADPRSVRQIVLNLLSNSIKFTSAGGQVIVSTALDDQHDVVLRVRDTGVGMSERDLTIAMEPFRQLATSSRWGSGGQGLGLPLTKALAEANRARFKIRSGVNAGTLVEVAFSGTRMAAE